MGGSGRKPDSDTGEKTQCVKRDDQRDDHGYGRVQPVQAIRDEDDCPGCGDACCSGGISRGVEQHRPHAQPRTVAVAVDVTAEDQRSSQHDHRCHAAHDEHGKTVNLPGAGQETIDGSRRDQHSEDQEPAGVDERGVVGRLPE